MIETAIHSATPVRTTESPSAAALRLRTLRAAGRLVPPTDPDAVRETAVQMAADLFFAPLLAEMRRFPLGRELVDGGRTESVFGEQLDQRIADHVARSADGLVDRLVREFHRQGSAAASPTADWALQQQLRGGAA